MNVEALIAGLNRQGIRLEPDGLIVEPASKLTDADRAAIRQAKPELLRILAPLPERIIEATFTPSSAPTCNAAAFPPCPVCRQVRYWLASGGRVLWGTKQCVSALRFHLTALDFHAVN